MKQISAVKNGICSTANDKDWFPFGSKTEETQQQIIKERELKVAGGDWGNRIRCRVGAAGTGFWARALVLPSTA